MNPAPVPSGWRRCARSRLRFELAGLAFACQKGFGPQEYARHLWGQGAMRWMGKEDPGAGEYLRKEARALKELYPDVSFVMVAAEPDRAELVFSDGCLGGWGLDRWSLAEGLGLAKDDLCAYCREAFAVWAGQLGLRASIGPQQDGTCRLVVVKQSPGDASGS